MDGDGSSDGVVFVDSTGAPTYNVTPTTVAGAVAEDSLAVAAGAPAGTTGSFTDSVNGTTFNFSGAGAAAASGATGTGANPSATIQAAADLVNTALGGVGTVYVQQGAYNEIVQVGANGSASDGVTNINFTSSLKPIVVPASLAPGCATVSTFGTGVAPTLTGGFDLN